MTKKKNAIGDRSGAAFVGFLLIGLATGLLYGRPDVGVLMGLGVGFIAMALLADKE
jgi:hypothetical protein